MISFAILPLCRQFVMNNKHTFRSQEIEFSFMKQSPKKQPLKERIFGLNDAVNDENFEMKKSAPMNRYEFQEYDNWAFRSL